MENYTLQLNDENIKARVELVFEEEVVGFVEVSSYGTGAFLIELAEIEKAHQGRGLYKFLINGCFSILGAQMLVSNNRNADSNFCYEHWSGLELEYDQEVTIGLLGTEMIFSAD